MKPITFRGANLNDVELLTQMNKELIEDEKSDNPMTIQELHMRMVDFIRNEWNAILLLQGEEVVGYALYQLRPNMYKKDKKDVYLRQYFIRRQFRGCGIGSAGFLLLRESILPKFATIIIDVLERNPIGKRFWESVGFEPYYTNMKLNKKDL